jgi:hypothetical protein
MRIRPLPLLVFILALLTCAQHAYATCTAPTGYSNFTFVNLMDGGAPLTSGQLAVVGTGSSGNPVNYHIAASSGGVGGLDAIPGTITDGALNGCLYLPDSALSGILYTITVQNTGALSAQNNVVDVTGVYVTGANFSFDAYAFPGSAAQPATPDQISIGTVTTLAPGASATASITGSPPLMQLNLGIPQGAPGSGGGSGYAFSVNGTTISSSVSGAFSVNGTVI